MMKTKTIKIDFSQLVDVSLEGFLNIIESLWFGESWLKTAAYLGDMSYQIIGVEPGNILVFEVTAKECELE